MGDGSDMFLFLVSCVLDQEKSWAVFSVEAPDCVFCSQLTEARVRREDSCKLTDIVFREIRIIRRLDTQIVIF